jgi:hypothetical protein
VKQFLNIFITTTLLLAFAISYGQTNSSLKVKAYKVIASLKKQNDYPGTGKDTLIDLNSDGYKDILIEFYSIAGTGLKNGILVCLYDRAKKKFESCEQLNHLANPTFYFSEGIVVGYYLGGNNGSATKLKWHGKGLDTIESIDINVMVKKNEVKAFKLVSYNYITKKKTTKILDMMHLPEEYRYMDYEPIIKVNSR